MSVKQDGSMVRTAQGLEQKYKLSEMRKAFEQSENTITRVNQILQDYVNTIVGTIDNFEGLSDGMITTYFYDGIPTLETEPTVSWTDITENHVNDMYYDRGTGKAYTFADTDGQGTYSWIEVEDSNKIKVLAMANATVDAKDNRRRLFLEEPITPYDNGDLWLKDGVIYICQISKPETEVFETHDFIVSSQYSGDTLAIKVGAELEVLRGTVLKVIEDADFLRVELQDLDQETTSSIEFIKNALSTLITDEKGQSMMKQTTDGWVFEMTNILETLQSNSEKVGELENSTSEAQSKIEDTKDLVKKLEEKTTYVNMGQRDGQPCIELGAIDSDFKVVITNTEILFMEGDDIPAYMSNKTMVIRRAYIEEQMQISTMAWVKRHNNHISFMGVSDNASTE